MQYVSCYRSNAVLSGMFFSLMSDVFGLDIAGWAARGCWGDSYCCHSLIEGGRMVANVSTTRITLLIDGEEHPAWQLGSVCTRPEYRGRGCARTLLERVIDITGGRDMFLFANPNARGLYQRLGFAPAPRECRPVLELAPTDAQPYVFRRIRALDAVDVAAANAVYSPRFDARTDAGLAGLYMHDFYADSLYLCDETGTCAVWERDGDALNVRALYGPRPADPARLTATFAATGATRAVFSFMPDGWGIDCPLLPDGPDETFTMGLALPDGVAYPDFMRA